MGKMELMPSDFGREANSILNRLPIHCNLIKSNNFFFKLYLGSNSSEPDLMGAEKLVSEHYGMFQIHSTVWAQYMFQISILAKI